MVYDVKPDLTHNARLVYDDIRVNPRGLSICATVVKGVSVLLLDIISDSQSLKVTTGDIDNAFIQVYIKEKIYTNCGPEFGDRDGSIATTFRALCGLTTSTERFRTILIDFLRTLEFTPSHFDRDV